MGDRIGTAKPVWRKIADFPLVALAIAIVAFSLVTGAFSFATKELPGFASKDVVNAIETLVLIGLLIVLHKLVLRRLGEDPHDDLPFYRAPRDLALGTGVAFVLFSVIVGVAALLGAYRIDGWGGWSEFLRILFGAGISAGFIEEYVFRGILFRWLEQFGGSWFSLAITSALFGLVHIMNDNATWLSSFAIAVEAGILLGGAYMLTRSLWFAMGIHFGWNVTQGFIWDVPVSGHAVEGLVQARLQGSELLSGGGFGLEASVIAMLLATAVGFYLVWLAIQRGELVRPWWVRRRMAHAGSS